MLCASVLQPDHSLQSAAGCRWHGRTSGARHCTEHSSMHCLFVWMEKYNIRVQLCAYTYAVMNFQGIRQVPGLELRWQIKALLPHQEICEVLQQNLEQLLRTPIELRLQHTLILHKIRESHRNHYVEQSQEVSRSRIVLTWHSFE